MFDTSFKRSKDYFVALQILRIVDEWLDEVQSTVEDMFKDPVLLKASMWADNQATDKSFQIAIRYMNENFNATKSRVRKKNEEINSLRDGVSPCHPFLVQGVANTLFTAVQRHISSRVYQGYGVKSGNLRLHRCYSTIHPSELLSGR